VVEEHPCLRFERRRCHCKRFLIILTAPTVDHAIAGPHLDHRRAVLRCWPQSVPLIIVVRNLYRYVTLAAALGSFVYNTYAIYPFHPFIPVF